ncbi:MAG: AmmeMemoRadiSam system protein B [Candidatus Magasanikbacteria bacterium]
MPIVFAAITPHPPILIEGIGKEQKEKINKTINSFAILEKDLYVTKPDIIVILSPHNTFSEKIFSINLATEFVSYYEKFGYFATTDIWKGETTLSYIIKEKTQEKDIPIQIITEKKLDHSTSIPLSKISKNLTNIKILPINTSQQTEAKTLLDFGKILYEILADSEKRIAIIASADLSHALTNESPAGYHKAGKEFDETIIKLLETHNTVGITQMDKDLIKNSEECGYNSILILLGCLKNIKYEFKNLSYESPLGIGYLTGEFVF